MSVSDAWTPETDDLSRNSIKQVSGQYNEACSTNQNANEPLLFCAELPVSKGEADLWARSSSILNHFRRGVVILAAPQDCHCPQIVEPVLLARLKLGVVRRTEDCHQLALCTIHYFIQFMPYSLGCGARCDSSW